MNLYHYYDKRSGPFKSLTALSNEEAFLVLEKIKAQRPDSFTAQRDMDYIISGMRTEHTDRSDI